MFGEVKDAVNDALHTEKNAAQTKMRDTMEQLRAARERLNSLTLQQPQPPHVTPTVNGSSSAVQQMEWTASYEKWDRWNTVERLEEASVEEKERLQSLRARSDSSSTFSHMHDHTEERKIFEMPETDKVQYCEAHRAKGNYLFHEGLLPKAAEQYQIALSYYAYCFPEGEDAVKKLNALRVVCLCNLALCYIRTGYYRKAIESATIALQENAGNAKALYYRARAHRELDEYGLVWSFGIYISVSYPHVRPFPFFTLGRH
jgi:tetratricopeptide (TPR) repeat protein